MSDETPYPDPFEGMSPAQRKQAQEDMILRMAYDVPSLTRVHQRERPDFAVWIPGNPNAVGVEITQIFQSESHARLSFINGYAEDLWSGGRHRHRDDVHVLEVSEATVTDKDGNVKHEALPVIVTRTATAEDFRAGLASAIRHKASLNYSSESFSHLNLVVLDWYRVPFDSRDYPSDRLLDAEVREALRSSPFREVHLLIYDTSKQESDETAVLRPRLKRIRLQQLFLLEQYYLTAHAIDASTYGERLTDEDELANLTADYLTRVVGLGTCVVERGVTCVSYRGASAGLSHGAGFHIFDHLDFPVECQSAQPAERLPDDVVAEVTTYLERNVFRSGWSEDIFWMPFNHENSP